MRGKIQDTRDKIIYIYFFILPTLEENQDPPPLFTSKLIYRKLSYGFSNLVFFRPIHLKKDLENSIDIKSTAIKVRLGGADGAS